MDERDWLAERFEEQRPHQRATLVFRNTDPAEPELVTPLRPK